MSSQRIRVVRPSDVASEVNAYSARVVAAGGTISAAALTAVGAFIQYCKLKRIWDKLVDVGPFAGNQLTAALVKLKYPTGTGLLTNHNFVNGDYTQATGLNGDGATKYLRTGINFQDHISSAYASMAIYSRTAVVAGAGKIALGAEDVWIGANFDGGTMETDFTTENFVVSDKSAAGFYAAAVEHPAQLLKFYNKDGLLNEVQPEAGGADDFELYVFARHAGGVAADFWGGRLSFYCFGEWMNAADIAALATAVQNLQTDLGRAV